MPSTALDPWLLGWRGLSARDAFIRAQRSVACPTPQHSAAPLRLEEAPAPPSGRSGPSSLSPSAP